MKTKKGMNVEANINKEPIMKVNAAAEVYVDPVQFEMSVHKEGMSSLQMKFQKNKEEKVKEQVQVNNTNSTNNTTKPVPNVQNEKIGVQVNTNKPNLIEEQHYTVKSNNVSFQSVDPVQSQVIKDNTKVIINNNYDNNDYDNEYENDYESNKKEIQNNNQNAKLDLVAVELSPPIMSKHHVLNNDAFDSNNKVQVVNDAFDSNNKNQANHEAFDSHDQNEEEYEEEEENENEEVEDAFNSYQSAAFDSPVVSNKKNEMHIDNHNNDIVEQSFKADIKTDVKAEVKAEVKVGAKAEVKAEVKKEVQEEAVKNAVTRSNILYII